MTRFTTAKFGLGQIVRHRHDSFRGVVVDVDAAYAGPAHEPGPDQRDQPFYRVLAMGMDSGFLVYAAEAVLEPDTDVAPLSSTDQAHWFSFDSQGRIAPRAQPIH
ncbi:MAG: heat shock protein HspQ [Brevundimonas sp.]|uniref:heat shock protein HspQ n=1 Tax=Brevundimonas sp. TaxID=1871086 RepID=UPI002734B0FA|nr:heat shock protein HspQ [Brevundimonas sp.]MBX9615151.1 heat shock protein HspQ [Caulobacteraceae bacterium]MDP3406357.1 heat shock protein HspQ [Brevundimonas sp.]